MASGWDNVTFRLGADLAVRLPRREAAAVLLVHEQRWLGRLAPHLPLPIPVPLRFGRPGSGYPWPWSIVPWFDGDPADVVPPRPTEAGVLGAFLAALHRPVPAGAPTNPHRGVPLRSRAKRLDRDLEVLQAAGRRDVATVRAVFSAGIAAPPARVLTWLHGDLHPRNVLTSGGRLSAVLDWGDVTAGDPATDVAGLWMLFPTEAQPAFWEAYGAADPGLEARGRGWAAVLGAVLLRIGLADADPRVARVGRTTLARLAGEP